MGTNRRASALGKQLGELLDAITTSKGAKRTTALANAVTWLSELPKEEKAALVRTIPFLTAHVFLTAEERGALTA